MLEGVYYEPHVSAGDEQLDAASRSRARREAWAQAEKLSQEDYDRMVREGEDGGEGTRRFYHPPYSAFGRRTGIEFNKLKADEGHATAHATLSDLGIEMRPQRTGDRDIQVKLGDWLCLRMQKVSDNEWKPCFNHVYRGRSCQRHTDPQWYDLALDSNQAAEAPTMVYKANDEYESRRGGDRRDRRSRDRGDRGDPFSSMCSDGGRGQRDSGSRGYSSESHRQAAHGGRPGSDRGSVRSAGSYWNQRNTWETYQQRPSRYHGANSDRA